MEGFLIPDPPSVRTPLGQKLFSLLVLVVTTSISVQEVWGSRPGPVKSDTVLPGIRHRGYFLRTSKLGCLGAQRRKRAPLHALAEYREYNEGLIFLDFIL